MTDSPTSPIRAPHTTARHQPTRPWLLTAVFAGSLLATGCREDTRNEYTAAVSKKHSIKEAIRKVEVAKLDEQLAISDQLRALEDPVVQVRQTEAKIAAATDVLSEVETNLDSTREKFERYKAEHPMRLEQISAQ